jgi:iron complex transport system ATP-binding protein
MLVIDHLTAAYKQHIVLHGVSLTLAPGEVLGLVGPNGAGKSSLIRAISGLVSPRSGAISWQGLPLHALSPAERARIIAVVPQAEQLGGAFTVEQTILLGRTPYMGWLGKPSARDRAAVRAAMEQTSIPKIWH